jgi:ADP-heptose:LPS heptosyltransferase
MEVTTMRFIDGWIGTPICALLTAVRKVTDPFRHRAVDPPRRILVVKLAEQGATVVAYSALKRAIEMVGPGNVFFLVFAENRFIIDQLNLIPAGNVIELRTDRGLPALASDIFRALARCWKEKLDTSVDFEYYARASAILSYLSGASRRVGFHSFAGEASYRGDLMTHRLVFNPFLHAGQIFRFLVEAIAVPAETLPAMDTPRWADEQPPMIEPTAAEIKEVDAIVRRVTGRETRPPLILLNANTGDLLPLRRWPRERYIELAGRLLEHYPQAFVGLTGSPSEAAGAQELVDRIGSDRCVNFGGTTTLRQLLILYFLSEVMVTNDSGPAHYSALTPIDVITLFGPETPAAFGSLSPRSHLFWAGLPCSPCINAFNDRWSPCRNNLCMQALSVDEVFRRVCQVFDERQERSAGTTTASF